MKKLLSIVALLSLLCACTQPKMQTADYRVVPLPKQIELAADTPPFILKSSTRIAYDADSLANEAEFLRQYVQELTGIDMKIDTAAQNNVIRLSATLQHQNPEAYEITVSNVAININGASAAGTFYGVQTLRKSIPAAITPSQVEFPAGTIADYPRFAYRGAHLDVARHPMEPDSVKAYIDMLALHNINQMHWHLADDQGWRIEIKSYPKLTELGSHRDGTMIGRDFDSNDSIPVDGFYTQEQARDIVEYAAKRHINIIPEIDMPGHMVAALKGYPELGCTGGPYDVWEIWGISDEVLCPGNDSTFVFIDAVLDELCDIFPSQYIHLGGDECPKVRWESCPKCQARIRELGLKGDDNFTAEQKLQGYFMDRARQTLDRRGRVMIGWDEILEGDCPEGAVVMAWRDAKYGLEAARQGHRSIMTPTKYMYIDYCQSMDPETEPVCIGGYLPVEMVYSFEPITDEFTPEEAALVMGVQANLWREYIKTLSHTQYMSLPRLAALSEVQWLDPEQKNYDDFLSRLPRLISHYDALGYNYARHIYDVSCKLEPNAKTRSVEAVLSTSYDEPIYYTLDGSEPTQASTLYEGPVQIDRSCTLKAVAVCPDGSLSHVLTADVRIGKSTFAAYAINEPKPHPRFTGEDGSLTDGVLGKPEFHLPQWTGIQHDDLSVTIDLGSEQTVSKATASLLVQTGSWIYDCRAITVETSVDGQKWTKAASEEYPQATGHANTLVSHTVDFAPVEARYVRVNLTPERAMPQWHREAAGYPAFVFADEITID